MALLSRLRSALAAFFLSLVSSSSLSLELELVEDDSACWRFSFFYFSFLTSTISAAVSSTTAVSSTLMTTAG
jgi:hypothetical protein